MSRKARAPLMVIIERQGTTMSSCLLGIGLGAGGRGSMALEQHRGAVITRTVTFTGFGNCF